MKTATASKDEIIRKQAQTIRELSKDKAFDILTRSGLELLAWPEIASKATFVIFADIDFMHDLNGSLGYEKVNELIRKSIHVRQETNHRLPDIGRWFSGDEIIWIIQDGDPVRMARSIRSKMIENGLSATFGIAPIVFPELDKNVSAAIRLVELAKRNNLRGTINHVIE
jgi:hypothetical protein